MNIQQLAEKLNSLAISEDFEIAKLPELRKKHLGKKQLPNKIFTAHTIFGAKDNYAFHHGGRAEIQFNFGTDYLDGKEFTRYAICFSLKPSHSLPNPVDDLEPFRKKFNECIDKYPELFDGLLMWYYQNNNRNGNYSPRKIPDKWFKINTFIAIGNIIEKPIDLLNEADLLQILAGFDKFFPIYKFCVLNYNPTSQVEKRIAKVCWNVNNWTYPSGPYGKSKQLKSHENERGYGLEEWLFDFEKTIDGFHYALLQPVQKGRVTFLNKYFDVRLFSHNSVTSENVWIGSIKKLKAISYKEADRIYAIYLENGWIDEMVSHIKSVNGDYKFFKSLFPRDTFNVRFKPENAVLYTNYRKVDDFKTEIGTYHYQFIRDKTLTSSETKTKSRRRNFIFSPSSFGKNLKDRISKREKKAVQSKPVHDKIQKVLFDYLVKKYGVKNVGSETDTGLLTRIDIAVNSPKGIILYEVKSYASVMISIRIALGQLLEYAYYPNPIKNISSLIVVSHIPIDEVSKEYLKFLRSITSLKIFYQSVNIDTEEVSEIF